MLNLLGVLAASGGGTAGAYESIASATGTGASGTITFSSIPSTYVALQVRYLVNSGRAVNGQESVFVTLNSDTGTNYSRHYLLGNGAAASASGSASQNSFTILAACGLDAPKMGVGLIDIQDYNSTTRNKTVRILSGVDFNDGTTESRLYLESSLWMNTNSVSSITFTTNTGSSFTTATQFALYGIKGA